MKVTQVMVYNVLLEGAEVDALRHIVEIFLEECEDLDGHEHCTHVARGILEKIGRSE